MKKDHRKKLIKACVAISKDVAVRQSLRAHLRSCLWGEHLDGSIIPESDREYSYHIATSYFERALRDRDLELLEFLGRNIPKKNDEHPKTTQNVEMAAFILRCLVGEDYRGFVGEEISNLSGDESAKQIWAALGYLAGQYDEPFLPKKAEVRKRLNLSARRVKEFYHELAEESGLDLDERRVETNVWS